MSSTFYLRNLRVVTYKLAFATTSSPIFGRFAVAAKLKSGVFGFKFIGIHTKRLILFKGGRMSVLKGRPLAKLWQERNKGKSLDQ